MRAVLTVLMLVQPTPGLRPWRGDMIGPVLAAHNSTRARHGAAPLAWDDTLAANALAYAVQLARTNSFQHDSTPGRRKREGENLWMGRRGAYGFNAMTAGFLAEERLFRPGIYPQVSATGNWNDVAHFTQVVWPSTTAVGCGLASNEWNDFFVCRYSPPGNKDGNVVR